MAIVYLGVGSNISPEANIAQAQQVLKNTFDVLAVSPVYQCPAFGFDGDDFLNLVVKVETTMLIEDVIQTLRSIEYDFGRPVKSQKYSSRSLDIDLLMYDDFVGEAAGYKIPRQDVARFDFVLKPLVDIDADLVHPELKLSMHQLWQRWLSEQVSHLIEK